MTPDPVTILVVDDDDAGRYVKAHILASNGYEVSEAETRTPRHRSGGGGAARPRFAGR